MSELPIFNFKENEHENMEKMDAKTEKMVGTSPLQKELMGHALCFNPYRECFSTFRINAFAVLCNVFYKFKNVPILF